MDEEGLILIEGPYGVIFFIRIDASEVQRAVDKASANLKDLRPLWKFAANVMRQSFAENFRQGGRPKWKALKQNTLIGKSMNPSTVYATMRNRARIRRLEQMRGGKMTRSIANILIQSGALRDSYTTKNSNHIERVSKDRMEIGSDHWLAGFHEYGTGVAGPSGKAFEIRPKRARSLRWFGPYGPIFAHKVINPGVPARPVAIIQDEDVQAIVKEAQRFVAEGTSAGQ